MDSSICIQDELDQLAVKLEKGRRIVKAETLKHKLSDKDVKELDEVRMEAAEVVRAALPENLRSVLDDIESLAIFSTADMYGHMTEKGCRIARKVTLDLKASLKKIKAAGVKLDPAGASETVSQNKEEPHGLDD